MMKTKYTTMNKRLLTLITLILLTGCEEKPFYVASIGNAGSLDGPYSMGSISVADVLGGGGGFGYGAVNGYPGKIADIGRMGVPKHIEGYWVKGWKKEEAFYKISADIDSELAENKFVLSEAITNTTNVIWGLCRLKLKIFASITL
jgi:hypothetical protein